MSEGNPVPDWLTAADSVGAGELDDRWIGDPDRLADFLERHGKALGKLLTFRAHGVQLSEAESRQALFYLSLLIRAEEPLLDDVRGFLSDALRSIARGKDANVAFGVKSGFGGKRSGTRGPAEWRALRQRLLALEAKALREALPDRPWLDIEQELAELYGVSDSTVGEARRRHERGDLPSTHPTDDELLARLDDYRSEVLKLLPGL
ncbi:MAG: hypothetical protein DWQ36_19585 [Acidobacteria bacterium]|nr:MAG: hypothetical protein DWQ30_06055 [Acidobacteriota bacterium]REK03743.1 MAG: hypothetical protein DWQ36_19585 [Acidobacteriota bacterium]